MTERSPEHLNEMTRRLEFIQTEVQALEELSSEKEAGWITGNPFSIPVDCLSRLGKAFYTSKPFTLQLRYDIRIYRFETLGVMIYGYAPVSQDLSIQLAALTAAGCTVIRSER